MARTVAPIRRALTTSIISLACLVLCGEFVAGRRTALPYLLEVEVRSGGSAAPERVRRNLEIELIGELDQVACFERVERYGEERDEVEALLLRLTIADVRRETSYDSSLAQRYDPDAPPQIDQGLMATVEAHLALELFSLPESIWLKEKRFTVTRRVRPTLGSDAKLEVEFEMIDEVTRVARTWACKGSAKKLAGRIEAARAAASSR